MGITGNIVAQQDRWALAFVIAKIGPVLTIARKLGKFCGKFPRDFWRIGEPKILVGLEPAKTVTDHHRTAHVPGQIRSRSVHRRSEKANGIARLTFGRDWRAELV